jgi:hypothetical protein
MEGPTTMMRPGVFAAAWCAAVASAWLVAAPVGAQTTPLKGVTMRVQQEILLGDMAAHTDYQARFVGGEGFRVEGKMRLQSMELDLEMTMVGDSTTVRHLTKTPYGIQAYVIDLAPIRAAFPEYAPAKTYDPRAYKELLDKTPDKKALPKSPRLDGVEVTGYEMTLAEGRLSMPANVSLALPDPARARVWIAEDSIPRRIELDDRDGRTYLKMSYTNVKTDVTLPADTLVFAFPPEVKPVNMTNMVLGAVGATRQPPAPSSPAPAPAPAGDTKGAPR